jgi:hypothetical protein
MTPNISFGELNISAAYALAGPTIIPPRPAVDNPQKLYLRIVTFAIVDRLLSLTSIHLEGEKSRIKFVNSAGENRSELNRVAEVLDKSAPSRW